MRRNGLGGQAGGGQDRSYTSAYCYILLVDAERCALSTDGWGLLTPQYVPKILGVAVKYDNRIRRWLRFVATSYGSGSVR